MSGFKFPKFAPKRAGAAKAAVCAICIVLSGCASPNLELPELARNLPPGFAAGGVAAQPDDDWWLRFGDPQLAALIDEAVRQNPQIGQAIARVEQARAQARIRRADQLPQISAAAGASRARQTLGGLGPIGSIPGLPEGEEAPSGFTVENYDLGLDVSWQTDLFGALRARSAAARAEFLASEANLRAARQAIAAQVARNYFTLVEARAQVALSEEVVETFGEIARQVGNRADVGIAPPNDKLLAISNLQSAVAGLQQREENAERLTRQLEVLLRDYPAGTQSTAEVLPGVPPPPPTGLPVDLLTRRPDVAVAEYNLRAAGFRDAAARRSLLPSLNLTGSAGTASDELGNLLDGDFFVWSIAGRLLQPIFQGGRLRAQVRFAEGQRDEASERYAETLLTALSEVEIALAIDGDLTAREVALTAAAAAAQESVGISFNRYRAGIDPFLTVLQSQQNALDARSSVLATRRARLENRVALHLALGGGFGSPASTPAFIGASTDDGPTIQLPREPAQ
ncbi:efflux transporter outer membrane subunit [Pseudopontixanthobacter vadosimaris]|uniref:efflux transporter outer membrane subunit n=1 Tax=Pseudopontixanthobacter vadosimaris TaxID=2726450 RepID=UPI0014741EF8|nr:efflux transporter outer membrane subunit [Pseudopontixanthobacter vadosimaris]